MSVWPITGCPDPKKVNSTEQDPAHSTELGDQQEEERRRWEDKAQGQRLKDWIEEEGRKTKQGKQQQDGYYGQDKPVNTFIKRKEENE